MSQNHISPRLGPDADDIYAFQRHQENLLTASRTYLEIIAEKEEELTDLAIQNDRLRDTLANFQEALNAEAAKYVETSRLCAQLHKLDEERVATIANLQLRHDEAVKKLTNEVNSLARSLNSSMEANTANYLACQAERNRANRLQRQLRRLSKNPNSKIRTPKSK